MTDKQTLIREGRRIGNLWLALAAWFVALAVALAPGPWYFAAWLPIAAAAWLLIKRRSDRWRAACRRAGVEGEGEGG